MFIFLIIYNWTRSSATQPLDLIHWLHSLIWSIIHTNHSVSWYEKKTPPDLCRVICLQELALSGYSYDVLCISTHCCTFPSCHQTSIMPLCPCWGILLKILWLWEAIFIHSWGLVFVSVCVSIVGSAFMLDLCIESAALRPYIYRHTHRGGGGGGGWLPQGSVVLSYTCSVCCSCFAVCEEESGHNLS